VYKQQNVAKEKLLKAEIVKSLVDREQRHLPRTGTRKIIHLIKIHLQALGLKFQLDKQIDLMRIHNLQIKPRKRYTQTKNSKHWMRKWRNIIKGNPVSYQDQVWVNDITI
jgi:putative transposase